MEGVGDSNTLATQGVYQIKLPLSNKEKATLSGVCIDKITQPFPTHQLDDVEKDIHIAAGIKANELPKLPKSIGGEVDIMIAIKYLRYHPRLVFQMTSGLALYESSFHSKDGTTGVVGGPHRIFTAAKSNFLTKSDESTWYSNQCMLVRSKSANFNEDVSMLGFKIDVQNEIEFDAFPTSAEKSFNHTEEVGSEISYRCISCRNCKSCKNHKSIEAVSIKEEVE